MLTSCSIEYKGTPYHYLYSLTLVEKDKDKEQKHLREAHRPFVTIITRIIRIISLTDEEASVYWSTAHKRQICVQLSGLDQRKH